MKTTRCRCKQCGNMYQTKSDNARRAKKCNVCLGTATTVNGNRITGLISGLRTVYIPPMASFGESHLDNYDF